MSKSDIIILIVVIVFMLGGFAINKVAEKSMRKDEKKSGIK
jgi:hypothetical protein